MDIKDLCRDIETYITNSLSEQIGSSFKLNDSGIVRYNNNAPIFHDASEAGKRLSFYCLTQHQNKYYAALYTCNYELLNEITNGMDKSQKYIYINETLPSEIQKLFSQKYNKSKKREKVGV